MLNSSTSMLTSFPWPVIRYLTIPLLSGNNLHAKLHLPPDLQAGDVAKYPLLLNMLVLMIYYSVVRKVVFAQDFPTRRTAGQG